jgi:hypothetical protein
VRQVDTNGAALDDPTALYSVALPVMPIDNTTGLNEDSTRGFSVWRKVTISPNGFPVIRVDGQGNAVGTAFGTGAGPAFSGGAGTLSAPTLGFPSPVASNPTSIAVSIPADWSIGDVFKLAYAPNVGMTSFIVLTHALTPTDITNNGFSIGIPTLSGNTYFQALGSHSGVDSANLSNIVAWGTASAPVITTSATNSVSEGLPLSVALTATTSVGVLAWTLSGGVDVLQEQISGSTLQWAGNGVKDFANPTDSGFNNVYDTQITCTDYCGNTAVLNESVTVTIADTTPNAFTFTDISNVAASTLFTSNTITISGLGASINAPATVTGGSYSKNGGAFQPAGSFTVANGDTIALQATSNATAGGSVNVVLSVGGASGVTSDTYTITTTGVSNQLDTSFNNASSGGAYTYSNLNRTAKNTNGIANKLALSLSTFTVGSGQKLYFEATADAASTGCNIGICDGSFDSFPGGVGAHTTVYNALGTCWYNNTQVSASFASWTTGDRIGIAFDVNNKKVWFCKIVAGVQNWQGAGNNPNTNSGGLAMSAAGTGNTFHFSIGANALNNQMTIVIDGASMACTPPTGFTTLL